MIVVMLISIIFGFVISLLNFLRPQKNIGRKAVNEL